MLVCIYSGQTLRVGWKNNQDVQKERNCTDEDRLYTREGGRERGIITIQYMSNYFVNPESIFG